MTSARLINIPSSITATTSTDSLNERSVKINIISISSADTMLTTIKSVGVIAARSLTACSIPVTYTSLPVLPKQSSTAALIVLSAAPASGLSALPVNITIYSA